MVSLSPYFAVSAELCHIWRVGAAVWIRLAASTPENRPPHPDRTSSGSDSCGCWCSSWPSPTNVAERFYLQLQNKETRKFKPPKCSAAPQRLLYDLRSKKKVQPFTCFLLPLLQFPMDSVSKSQNNKTLA